MQGPQAGRDAAAGSSSTVRVRVRSAKNDNDVAGSTFAKLRLVSKKQTKTSIKLNWSKVKGAVSYTIYGNKCGKGNKYKKIATKAKKLKKSKSLLLKAKAKLKKGMKVKLHKKLRYESTNKKIATVSKTGKIIGKKKGTCYVYAYAQNGVYKKLKVTVK